MCHFKCHYFIVFQYFAVLFAFTTEYKMIIYEPQLYLNQAETFN